MNGTMPKRMALSLLIALTLIAAACGDDSSEDGDAAPDDSTTTTTAPPEDAVEPDPWTSLSEGPGRFRTEGFAVPFSFTVEEGWIPVFTSAADNANVQRRDVAVLFALATTAASPDDLIAQIGATEGVELTGETTVDVGGQPGVRYVAGGDHSGVAIEAPSGVFTLDAPIEEAGRVTVLEVDGTVLALVEITGPGRSRHRLGTDRGHHRLHRVGMSVNPTRQ